jgi:hypothetical protein
MNENIIATVFGQDENPRKVTQRMQRSIQRCIENYINEAAQLVFSNLEPDADVCVDMEADADENANVDAVNEVDKKDDIGETLKKLLSKHITRRNITLIREHHNGRETVFVARPCTTSPKSFVREAEEHSKWVTQMLPDMN